MRLAPAFSLTALLALGLGCRRGEAPPTTSAPTDATPTTDASGSAGPRDAADFGPPTRWQIDGASVAEDPSLPVALDRALREHGRLREDVQDHIVVDLNGDDVLDAVVLLPAPGVAGSYDVLALLSSGESVRVHELAGMVDHPVFAVAVLPLIDGPTLIAAGPRLGSCERGPAWTFLRPTGELLEAVGRLSVEPYDCAKAPGEIVFVREADGRVRELELHAGGHMTVLRWDIGLGQFQPVAPP